MLHSQKWVLEPLYLSIWDKSYLLFLVDFLKHLKSRRKPSICVVPLAKSGIKTVYIVLPSSDVCFTFVFTLWHNDVASRTFWTQVKINQRRMGKHINRKYRKFYASDNKLRQLMKEMNWERYRACGKNRKCLQTFGFKTSLQRQLDRHKHTRKVKLKRLSDNYVAYM